MAETKTGAKAGAKAGERIAKVMARAGVCSRREAERLIAQDRVEVNGKPVTTIPQALFSYRKLRKKKRLQVDITRRDGSQVKLRYRLT